MLKRMIIAAALILTGVSLPAGELKPARIFAENMVLQRDAKVPVWGWADAGTAVTVEFGDQKVTGTTAADGRWQVNLAPLKADKNGRTMTISAAGKTIKIDNIVIGDVWLCSGQSNMAMTLNRCIDKSAAESLSCKNIRFIRTSELLSPTPIKDVPTAFSTWQPVAGKAGLGVSAIAFFFARELQKKLDVPIGLIVSAWSGSQIITWIPPQELNRQLFTPQSTKSCDLYAAIWKSNPPEIAKTKILEEMKKSPVLGHRKWAERKLYWRPLHYFPGWTFNTKIAPLVPFAIKGFVWYQGEDNNGLGEKYGAYLETMATAWRHCWKENLPFYVVMLPPFGGYRAGILPRFWNGQLDAVRKMGNAEVACAVDVGNFKDIHPTNKEPVGYRLAMAALKNSYGIKNSAPGPVFKSMEIKEKAIIVKFARVASGLKGKSPLPGFELAGRDKKFHPAQAKLSGHDTVTVECKEVPSPLYVRYAWSNTPTVALYNGEGFPVLPFNTQP